MDEYVLRAFLGSDEAEVCGFQSVGAST